MKEASVLQKVVDRRDGIRVFAERRFWFAVFVRKRAQAKRGCPSPLSFGRVKVV